MRGLALMSLEPFAFPHRPLNQRAIELSKDRLKGLSVERLMRFLTSLNHDVAIVIREPAAQDASSWPGSIGCSLP